MTERQIPQCAPRVSSATTPRVTTTPEGTLSGCAPPHFAAIMPPIRVRRAITVSCLCLLSLAGCSKTSSETASPPSASAAASAVLESYLQALVAGDCTAARAVAASTFRKGDGDLCGSVDVKAYSVNEAPASPGPDEVVYGTVLTTSGSSDGTIAPGKTTWFYDLKRQDGQWRLTGGGSGP